jgi:hypothetical protein
MDRKLWHGINERKIEGYPKDTSGKCSKLNKHAIRAIAIKQGREAEIHHPTFHCPGCEYMFLLEYGIFSRIPAAFTEYEYWCRDCYQELHLEKAPRR